MGEDERKFIMRQLMEPGFIENAESTVVLTEEEESGKSELRVKLCSKENLCIANLDKKKTELHFFLPANAMYKRVDHMIFERKRDGNVKLHLIEMKSSVGERKWVEVKGKFRASYLLALALAGMLALSVSETVMYTTFEKVEFRPLETMPSARRLKSGEPLFRMEEEWSGMRFGLNFGTRIPFLHIPIQMERGADGRLTGAYIEK